MYLGIERIGWFLNPLPSFIVHVHHEDRYNFNFPMFSNGQVKANSADPDQTAPIGL